VTTMFLMMGHARPLTFKRDGGVCAWCGVETEPLREYLDGLFSVDRALHDALRARWNFGFSTFGGAQCGHLWEADHIQPWSEGILPTMDNLRTLCRACHKDRTRAWHRERADARRGQLTLTPRSPHADAPE
jgi:hypothetical protein